MNHGSLFSGIGGFDLAAEWMGWKNLFNCEWEEFPRKVLKHHFPNAEQYGDIREFNASNYAGRIDILSGGFPCQPYSVAGKRLGKEDARHLWPEMLRVIREVKPTYVLGENVAGLVSMENGATLDRILSDLENEGYTTESFIIPACGVGAWHRRDRIWIIGYREQYASNPNLNRLQGGIQPRGDDFQKWHRQGEPIEEYRTSDYGELQTNGNRTIEPELGGVVPRISDRLDGYWDSEPEGIPRVAQGIQKRVDRLKGLGNAIVPQVAYEIFKAIEAHMNGE